MKPSVEQPAESIPCRHLRTKKMYIPALAEDALNIEPGADDHSFYWCNKTQTALGRDDNPVHLCVCQPGRSCHES
jgi:hypothetical protein